MIGPYDKMVLDILFVKLDKPPHLIQIPRLPDNVVPIVKDKKTIQCTFPSDDKASLERQQVWVLPNFAMTDYASQGKTRPHNVVHLNSCTSHQSYYTCHEVQVQMAPSLCKVLNQELLQEAVLFIYIRNLESRRY